MDLAAPFGPVEGLATRIDFTDLLGLTSAPAQEARVRLIRAGIDVYDGDRPLPAPARTTMSRSKARAGRSPAAR